MVQQVSTIISMLVSERSQHILLEQNKILQFNSTLYLKMMEAYLLWLFMVVPILTAINN